MKPLRQCAGSRDILPGRFWRKSDELKQTGRCDLAADTQGCVRQDAERGPLEAGRSKIRRKRDSYSIQIAWRPTANFRWPKSFQPPRLASSRISTKLKARAAETRASLLVIGSR